MALNLLHLKIIGKGPPLILLHGWGWHSGIWSPLIPYLSDRFELFIPDLPGAGKSPPLPYHSLEEVADHLLTVLPEKAIWLGWSLGGMIAWWIAIHRPQHVSQLITAASSPRFISDHQWPGVSLPLLEKFGADLKKDAAKTGLEFLRLQLVGQPTLLAELQSQLLPSTLSSLEDGLEILRKTDMRADLKKIDIPSLHFFGQQDALVPIKMLNQLKPLLSLKAKTKIIPKSGHIPFLSQMAMFLENLNHFL